MQARKILIPMSAVEPELRAHAGHEWLYVLSGRMRLLLGGHDLVLARGEVADFDTHVPTGSAAPVTFPRRSSAFSESRASGCTSARGPVGSSRTEAASGVGVPAHDHRPRRQPPYLPTSGALPSRSPELEASAPSSAR
jgi:hypothetical protein